MDALSRSCKTGEYQRTQNLPGRASKNFISWKRAGSSRNEVENLRGFIERAEQNRAEARELLALTRSCTPSSLESRRFARIAKAVDLSRENRKTLQLVVSNRCDRSIAAGQVRRRERDKRVKRIVYTQKRNVALMRESSRAFISHQAQWGNQIAIREISVANRKLIHDTRSNVTSSGRCNGDMQLVYQSESDTPKEYENLIFASKDYIFVVF